MKIDLKTIIIGILLLALIGYIIFWPAKSLDSDMERIKELERQNTELLKQNDSLDLENIKKDSIIFEANSIIFKLNESNDSLNNRIKKLNKKRNETRDSVAVLDANGITSSLSDYLERSKSRN